MAQPRGLRWAAGLGASALIALAVVGVSQTAHAESQPTYTVDFPNLTVAPAHPVTRYVRISSTAELEPLKDVKVTIEAAGLAGVATVAGKDRGCTTAGTVTTCAIAEATFQLGPILSQVGISPVAGATVGRKGTFKTTVSAGSTVLGTATTKVTIGEEADLKAGEPSAANVKLGGRADVPVSVTNKGTRAVRNPVLRLLWPYAAEPVTRYDNCLYGTGEAFCEFKTNLATQREYHLSAPASYAIRKDTYAPGSATVNYRWYTAADGAEAMSGFRRQHPTAGNAGELRLEAAVTAMRAPANQTDTKPTDNGSSLNIKIDGSNKIDLEGRGATVRGTVGSTVKVKIGAINNGPAALDVVYVHSVSKVVGFIVPPGTTAVSVPRRCHVFDGENLPGSSEPGKPRYVCVVDNVVPVGATQSWEFELRLDREGESKGSVRANEPMTWTNGNEPDLKPANDEADVVVNAVKSGAGNPPAGGAGGGGAGGAATGLPVTGSNAVLLASGGALLVALGGVGYVVARRRRTRFVA